MRRRKIPDGLPLYLYQNKNGKYRWNIRFKKPKCENNFSFSCGTGDIDEFNRLLDKAIQLARQINKGDTPETKELTISKAFEDYFDEQENLHERDLRKKRTSTLVENKRESKSLVLVFGHMHPRQITKPQVQQYLAAREGVGAPLKGNKEVALLSALMKYLIRKGLLDFNPVDGVIYVKRKPKNTYISQEILDLVIEVGDQHKGQWFVLAKAMELAYLTTSRADEVRFLKTNQIKKEGLLINIGKRKNGQDAKQKLVEWTPRLKKICDDLSAFYQKDTEYLFCNQNGSKYSRSGWGSTWRRFKNALKKEADKRGIDWIDFSLTDMRPSSVTDRVSAGETNIKDATGHSSDRMIQQVYDRRVIKKIKTVTDNKLK